MPPAKPSVKLQMIKDNLGARCTRDGPETMLLLSHQYVEERLLGGRHRACVVSQQFRVSPTLP